MEQFSVVKVFSATLARERESLGEAISEWLRSHSNLQVVDKVVAQSSDKEFHCLSIVLFLADKK